MEIYEAMEDWAEMRALRHEDCSCEECLLLLEEEYEKLAEGHGRFSYEEASSFEQAVDKESIRIWREEERADLGEGC